MDDSHLPSELQMSMAGEGVRFKSVPTTIFGGGGGGFGVQLGCCRFYSQGWGNVPGVQKCSLTSFDPCGVIGREPSVNV